jgi:hypothetical protein
MDNKELRKAPTVDLPMMPIVRHAPAWSYSLGYVLLLEPHVIVSTWDSDSSLIVILGST